MKTKNRLLVSLFLASAPLASAQEITPVWFQHINETVNVAEADRLPILRKQGAEAVAFDGNSTMDGYSQLIRYDADRLLLGVRENGFDESAGGLSAEDQALAAAYPDRSLIWIDADTGKPMGVAWSEAIFPADAIGHDVTAEGQGSQGAKTQAFWRFGLDEGPEGQRALYSGYKHLILRYAPKAGGGWETTPTIAYEEQVQGVGDGLSSGDGFNSWRWRDFRVKGSGTNTTIFAGGGTWRAGAHPQLLVTTDGLNFTPAARLNDRDGGRRNGYALGGVSTMPEAYGTDPRRPNLVTSFHSHYPGTGYEARPNRYTADPDDPTPAPEENQQPGTYLLNQDESGAAGLPAFVWEAAGKDGLPIDHAVDGVTRYDGNWTGALAASPELEYIVNYSMPSWNNVIPGGIVKPAWVAIHRLDGSIASGNSAYKLNFVETDEPVTAQAPVGHDWLYDPWVEVYPDTSAPANLDKSEVLVTFGSTGFGVFTVQNVAATLVASPTNQTVNAGDTVTIAADVTGSPNDFQWYRDGVPLPTAPYYVGARKVALTIIGVTPSDAGSYQLKWTNPLSGAGETAPAQLTVNGSYVRWTGATDIAQDPVNAPLPIPGEVLTNANSFTIRASGYSAFDAVDLVGDNGFYRYETVTGDFDKRVRLVSLVSEPVLDPIAAMTRAGLMLRQSTAANTPTLEIFAANPDGANLVRVAGRGRVDQIYSQTLSRSYPGVADDLPNQWLRMRRVGNSFAFYVSTSGTNWSLISEQYQNFPATVLVGTFAAPDDASGASVAVAEFAEYGDVVADDNTAPTLVSVGTIDKKWVGVKFSEAVNSISSTDHSNYTLSQGTVVRARGGIGANTVYLEVFGLTNDTFTVTVDGVVDLAGNPVAANSTASGRVSNWTSTDIGYIQNPDSRPTVGDDPYLPGMAVAVSSDTNPEVEIIGGGSNGYNIGDYIHYLYRPYTGDFDVVVAVERFDKRGFAGGYANGGIHVRSGLYRTDNTDVGENTKVPAYVNVTYYEASGPNRAAIELNRPSPGADYGNNTPNGNDTEIAGLLGFFTGLTAVDAAGTISPQSSPTQAKWLRVKRTGNAFTSYFSYDGENWIEQDQGNRVMEELPETVLVGFGNQNDTGYGIPPNNTYAGNGTVNVDGLPTQNESNYGVLRISHFGDLATAFPDDLPVLTVARNGSDLKISWTAADFVLQSADVVNGPYTAAGLTVVPEGEASTVTVTPGGTRKFYRLVK